MSMKLMTSLVFCAALVASPAVAQETDRNGAGALGTSSGAEVFSDDLKIGAGVGALSTSFENMPRLPELAPSTEALDPAIAASLEEAESLRSSDPDQAAEIGFALLMSQDPFTVAQRPLFADRLTSLFRALADASDGRDQLILSDAAWIASRRSDDAQHGERLLEASREATTNGDNAEALWLVRRALLAAPDNDDAVRLEHRLSNNPNRGLGWGLFWGGLGSLGASAVFLALRGSTVNELTTVVHSRSEADALLARTRLFGTLSLAAAGAGLAGLFGSLGVMSAGERTYYPTSPADLPAAGDWK